MVATRIARMQGEEGRFTELDRQYFQLLVEHPFDPYSKLLDHAKRMRLRSYKNPENLIQTRETLVKNCKVFCDRWRCRTAFQVIKWEALGLQPFMTLGRRSWHQHPYCVREYQLIGRQIEYLAFFVAPNPIPSRAEFAALFPLRRIYPPLNAVHPPYYPFGEQEQESYLFVHWLLHLKEAMVEKHYGEMSIFQAPTFTQEISIESSFLEQLRQVYLESWEAGIERVGDRTNYQNRKFIEEFYGFIVPYLTLEVPQMENYVLIFEDVADPTLFAGGLVGWFYLAEIYEADHALICRILLPEKQLAVMVDSIFSHLSEICTPSIYLLAADQRNFGLSQQWEVTGQRWKKFTF
ncbi:MAG: hypothetical protein ACTSRS_13145 [Candidatus Helarchaeota archaeon]